MLTPLSDCLIRPRPIVEKLEANISPRLQKVLYELVVTSVMGVVSARDKRGHDDEVVRSQRNSLCFLWATLSGPCGPH
jgi:hypothetical protein